MAYEVPSWLQPMSQFEREKLAMAEDEARGRAATMLRKQIGLARLKEQYQGMVSSGVDDLTARKTALLNNAEFLFADHPEAVVNLQKNEEALAIRERAQYQLNAHREAISDIRERALAETERKNKELEEVRKARLESEDDARKARAELGKANLELGKKREARLTTAAMAKDPELQDIEADLAKARKNLDKAMSATIAPEWWVGKPENHRKVIRELEKRRAARIRELGGEAEDVPEEPAKAEEEPKESKTLTIGRYKVRVK